MKKIACALGVLGVLTSCGIGNSAGSSASTSSNGSSSAGRSSAGIFGSKNKVEQRADLNLRPDGRTLISVVKSARFERTRDGGIIHARGIAARQGYYKAKLVSPTKFTPDKNGILTLEFRAVEPQFQSNVLNERSREIDVGLFISNQKLAAARSIQISGQQNQIRLRR